MCMKLIVIYPVSLGLPISACTAASNRCHLMLSSESATACHILCISIHTHVYLIYKSWPGGVYQWCTTCCGGGFWEYTARAAGPRGIWPAALAVYSQKPPGGTSLIYTSWPWFIYYIYVSVDRNVGNVACCRWLASGGTCSSLMMFWDDCLGWNWGYVFQDEDIRECG